MRISGNINDLLIINEQIEISKQKNDTDFQTANYWKYASHKTKTLGEQIRSPYTHSSVSAPARVCTITEVKTVARCNYHDLNVIVDVSG